MIATASLLTVLVAASPAAGLTSIGSLSVVANVSLPFQLQRPRKDLRSDYRTLRRAARKATADPFQLASQLVGLYAEISDPDSLPYSERQRAMRYLRLDLRKMSGKLVNIREDDQPKARRRRPARRVGSPLASAAGPETVARANQLIRLIQSTVCPESWDVNGGKGSIGFYEPLNVLVVRASAEVHGQVGGTLPNVGKR